MTDPKNLGATTPAGPAEKTATPIKPATAPQPDKGAPEASPAKQS